MEVTGSGWQSLAPAVLTHPLTFLPEQGHRKQTIVFVPLHFGVSLLQ